jgi:sirohydrochlorin ferrochelatase
MTRTAITSPAFASQSYSNPQLERLSAACAFARAREESRRGRRVEIVASLLFAGCVAVSIAQSTTAAFALNRHGALEQVVLRAMPKKTQVAAAAALPPPALKKTVCAL